MAEKPTRPEPTSRGLLGFQRGRLFFFAGDVVLTRALGVTSAFRYRLSHYG